MKVRREKMQQFIDAGVYPFGQKFDWDHHTQEIKDQAETLEKEITRKDIPAEAKKRAQTLINSLDEEGNNVILLAKMKK